MKNSMLYYSVGALLYCPANHDHIADSIIQGKFGTRYSLALCLEDAINDSHVAKAEDALACSLMQLYRQKDRSAFFLPKIFIRVRNASQMCRLLENLKEAHTLIAGFILPKFDQGNAKSYIQASIKINEAVSHKIHMMPILESPFMIDLRKRADVLYGIKEELASVEDLVLNIRVGGNDLCHLFGFRRQNWESIHSIRAISDIFSDIITIFGMDYVISGPVWEYYDGNGWDDGMRKELLEDRLCGFTGKTVIHPRQIPLVYEAYSVSREDYEDAKTILDWRQDAACFVSGNTKNKRMNEYKTHTNWAEKILYLAEAYGIHS